MKKNDQAAEAHNQDCTQKENFYRANADYLMREIAGETILVPTGEAASQFNGLATMNASGAFLWRQLAQKCTREDLYQALAEEYDLPQEQAQGDVDRFLDLAVERGLVLRG